MALGHPFIDAMFSYVGSYDFGGLTAIREIALPRLSGQAGFLFVFIVRHCMTREDGDKCLFEFVPVFVTAEGEINESAANLAVNEITLDSYKTSGARPDSNTAFQAVKRYLEQKASIWDWEEDVQFIGMNWALFKKNQRQPFWPYSFRK